MRHLLALPSMLPLVTWAPSVTRSHAISRSATSTSATSTSRQTRLSPPGNSQHQLYRWQQSQRARLPQHRRRHGRGPCFDPQAHQRRDPDDVQPLPRQWLRDDLGLYFWAFTPRPPTIDLRLPPAGTGTASATLYARVNAGQTTLPALTIRRPSPAAIPPSPTPTEMSATAPPSAAPMRPSPLHRHGHNVTDMHRDSLQSRFRHRQRLDIEHRCQRFCQRDLHQPLALPRAARRWPDGHRADRREMTMGANNVTYGLYRDAARTCPGATHPASTHSPAREPAPPNRSRSTAACRRNRFRLPALLRHDRHHRRVLSVGLRARLRRAMLRAPVNVPASRRRISWPAIPATTSCSSRSASAR